jgi:hypothetical protein
VAGRALGELEDLGLRYIHMPMHTCTRWEG